ncbi:hypothetical protein [Streptomyces collinus]
MVNNHPPTDAVCHTYNTAGVHLVLIDEIHRDRYATVLASEWHQ